MTGVIQILADDAGYGDRASLHSLPILTPNIESLATNGRDFTRFYSASPVCSPSRCAFIMGRLQQYYSVHGADTPEQLTRYFLPSGSATVAKILQGHGVATAQFGKWHLGDPGQGRNTQTPDKFGFDRVFIGPGGRPGCAYVDLATYEDAYFYDVDIVAGTGGYVLQQFNGYAEDVVFAKVIEWVTAHAGEDFYIQIWTFAPHEPLSESVDEASNPAYSGGTTAQKTYWGTMTNLDNNIGLLLTALSNLGILATTHVVYTSDNGPESNANFIGETAGLRGAKTTLWEGGLRVPLIWQGPGVSAGSTDAGVRWALDWAPTVLNIFGLDVSGYPGSDLFAAAPTRDLTWHYNFAQRPQDPSGAWALLRGDRKLVRWESDGSDDRFFTVPNEADIDEDTGADPTEESSMSSALTSWFAAVPTLQGINKAIQDPATIEEANALMDGWMAEQSTFRLHACAAAGTLTSFEAALDSLFELPRTVGCSHGVAGMTESDYGSVRDTHETLGASSIITPGIVDACLDSTKRANCSAPELAAIDTVLSAVSSEREGG